MEYLVPPKYSLKIIYRRKHFPRIYRRKRVWVFFAWTQCSCTELTGGELNGYGEDGLQYAELKLISNARHRRRVLADEQRSASGQVGVTDRSDVSFVREARVVTFRRLEALLQLVLYNNNSSARQPDLNQWLRQDLDYEGGRN